MSAKNETNIKLKNKFDLTYNVSYYDSSLPRVTNKQINLHLFYSIILYGFGIFLACNNHWYGSLLNGSVYGVSTKEILWGIYFLYVIFAPIGYYLTRPKYLWESKSILVINYFFRILSGLPSGLANWLKGEASHLIPTYKEQQAMLLFGVKFFFGPQMIQYAVSNIARMDELGYFIYRMFENYNLQHSIEEVSLYWNNFPWMELNEHIYGFALAFLFFIDTTFFATGYLTEASFLKNRIRSVENSTFGILICIICYPPFNQTTNEFLNWVPNDYVTFMGDKVALGTWIFRWSAIFFLFIYASASVALFTKSSNLTNRGTVTVWPYSMIRHPAYISKNLFWWITGIPFFFTNTYAPTFDWGTHLLNCFWMLLSLCAWSLIYYLRAITEERHLMRDPEYRTYCEKVKYRFVPGVF